MDRQAIRRQMREQKRALTPRQIEAASEALAQRLFSHPLYRDASAIYGYLSYNQEVRTAPILRRAWQDGKRVAVPRVTDEGKMVFLWLDERSVIAPGYCGIPEPLGGEAAHDATALVLMPGLAFDAAGNRMGYGGGFYDRFLAEEPQHPTIALCYDFQLFPQLEAQAHDRPVDVVLSQSITEVENETASSC